MPTQSTSTPPQISPREYRERQARTRQLVDSHGYTGIAVVGRGGGTYDRHGDLWYLTGHYQAYPHLHDRVPLWSGRSHAILVLPVEGPSVLVCSAPEYEDDLPVDEVRSGGDFLALVRDALDTFRDGVLVGLDALPASLAGALSFDRLTAEDEFLEPLRRYKSNTEQAILRHAGAVASAGIDRLIETAAEGVTEAEAVAAGLETALRAGAWPYMVSIAAGDRVASFTGRPSPGYQAQRRFQAGDLVRLDYVIVYDGYYADFGRTFTIGPASRTAIAAVRRLHEALNAAVAAACPGVSAADVAAAGSARLGSAKQAYPPHWGHGLGLGWEGPWLLPDNPEVIEDGYALAIEASITLDGAMVSGEENVLVHKDGAELLSTSQWIA